MSSESVTLEQRMSAISRKLEIRPGYRGAVHLRGFEGETIIIGRYSVRYEVAYLIRRILPAVEVIVSGDVNNSNWNQCCTTYNNYVYPNDNCGNYVTSIQDWLLIIGVEGAVLFTLLDCIAVMYAISIASDNPYADPYDQQFRYRFETFYKFAAENKKPVEVRTQAEIQAVRDEWFSEFIIKTRKPIFKTIIKTIKTILTGEK